MTQLELTAVNHSAKRELRYAIVMLSLLFAIMGFVTWLNGTLIQFLKLACQLNSDLQAFFVTFAFYMAYFLLAVPSSYVLKKTGYKNGMALSLIILAGGSLLFVPAAHERSFGLFLTGLFVQAAGLTLLQTAANPYASIIGPIESAAKRISIMGICNKLAGALSPIILGAMVLKGAGEMEKKIDAVTDAVKKASLLDALALRVVAPYIIMAIVLVLLALLVKKSSLPEIDLGKQESTATDSAKSRSSIWKYPHLLLGALCLFLYVGVEVLAGDAIGIYGRSIGMPLDITRYFTTFTMIAMLAGYITGVFAIPRYISQQMGLTISAVTGIVFSLCVYFTSGYVAITFIALLGLANALMWPAIFPLGIDGLGKFTKTGAALMVMGIAGGALLPLLYGTLKAKPAIGNSLAFLICLLPSYVYILYYSVKGYKAGK